MALDENLTASIEAPATQAVAREIFLSTDWKSGWTLSFMAVRSFSQDIVALTKDIATRDVLRLANKTSESLLSVDSLGKTDKITIYFARGAIAALIFGISIMAFFDSCSLQYLSTCLLMCLPWSGFPIPL